VQDELGFLTGPPCRLSEQESGLTNPETSRFRHNMMDVFNILKAVEDVDSGKFFGISDCLHSM